MKSASEIAETGIEPVIGIVIPLFRHSVLVGDALASVLAQETDFAFVAAVVNDGCPYSDSEFQVEALRALRPDCIRSIYRTNGGLSAARNTGIAFLLETYPTIQAVFFLDADNRLRPKALDSAYRTLIAHPETGWVFPNIDMFGLRRHFDYAGTYALLRHVFYNICEAGSLVHRRVFEAGVRFDETMKQGYEDWDFWLSAAARGFQGIHDPHFGFLYRNRPASMLSGSKRDSDAILADMRRKHSAIMNPRALLRLEAQEAPRHALIRLDTGEVQIGLDADGPQGSISIEEFGDRLWRTIVMPTSDYVPPVLLFAASATFERLLAEGVLYAAAYDAEVSLLKHNVATYVAETAAGETIAIERRGSAAHCDLLAIEIGLAASILSDDTMDWAERLPAADAACGVVEKTLVMPGDAVSPPAEGVAMSGFLAAVRRWRAAPFRSAAQRQWVWRELSVPPTYRLRHDIRQSFGGAVPFARVPGVKPNIGFVLHIARFGGVERVAYCVARQLSAAGAAVHLFVIGAGRAELPRDFAGTFKSVNFIEGPNLGRWSAGTQFQGTALPAITQTPEMIERIVAALGWLDIVINHHAGDLNEAAGALRRLGVKTANYLHLLDRSQFGRASGHPVLGLAYEHAYDLVIGVSASLISWLHGAGVPADKLLLVRNAPGHDVAPARRTQIVAHRIARRDGTLRALFLGRLDRQKGIDRLAAVIERSQASAMPVTWRIVGSAVTDGVPLSPEVERLVEPPVYDAEALVDLLGWADVLILLSDYEGVPLSILEAQRLGVVVIATDVGGVSEIIESGRNGFLVDINAAVDETLALLQMLAANDAVRSSIAAAACDVADWPQTTAPLIDRLGLPGYQKL